MKEGPGEATRRNKSLASKVAAVAISGTGVLLILGLADVAAISAPKFMRFQDRSRQSECKTNLRALAAAEADYFGHHGRYSQKVGELRFSLEKHNRYQYRLGPGPLTEEGFAADTAAYPDLPGSDAIDSAIPSRVRTKLGVQGTCPDCEFTAVCVGNIDSDSTFDIWSITVSSATGGYPGELTHHVKDGSE